MGHLGRAKYMISGFCSKSLIYIGITTSGPQEIGHILGNGKQHALVGRIRLDLARLSLYPISPWLES